MAATKSEQLEAILAQVLVAEDPAAALAEAAARRKLSAALRRALLACDVDGVRLTALLIAKLRFERLLRASEEAEWLYTRDPQSFAELFQRYHRTVPATAFFPAAEARLFREFLATLSAR